MNTLEVITERLDKLGALGSASQIRDYFVQEGITGYTGIASSCVVAEYLYREIKAEGLDRPYLQVTARFVENAEYFTRETSGRIDGLPEPVSDLIRAFDNRQFPELEREMGKL